MKHFICICLLCFIVSSCAIDKGIDFKDIPQYRNSDGHKNCYLVDTIFINNAIIVEAKDITSFIMDEKVFKQYNGKTSFFYTHPDVYLFTWWENGLRGDVIPWYANSCLTQNLLSETDCNNKYKLRTWRILQKTDKMLFILINWDYYNRMCVPLYDLEKKIKVESNLKLKNLKFSYYKLAVPLCE